MDKEEIKRAASEAVKDLQLDCEITEISSPIGKDIWCIQFTGSYGQFCDSFHDKAGKENSARLIREKIKRFFLKQRKPARIVRGRSSAARERGGSSSGGSGGQSNLLGTLLEVGEGAIRQAARIGGEVIERATTVNRTVLETEADWIQTISPTAAELIRPGSGGGTVSEVAPAQRTVEPPPAQTRSKEPSRAFKSTQKSSPSSGKKATVAKKARSTKKSKPAASKKSAVTSTKKSEASKRSLKASKKKLTASTKRKKGSSKKSGSKKSKGAIKLFF